MDRDGHAGGGAATFRRLGTIGVEEEYFIVDETGRPVAGTDTLVYGPDPQRCSQTGLTTSCLSV